MEIDEQRQAALIEGASSPGEWGKCASPLAVLFVLLFAQLIMLILVSFIVGSGPVFVSHHVFGLDLRDFYRAAAVWQHNGDPYPRGRLYTPPASILVGLALQWASAEWASRIMLVANVSLALFSLRSLVRLYRLSRTNELLLYGTSLVYYPFFFLVQRGNLDAIMLALLTACLAARRPIFRAAILGASVAIKVYTGLFFLLMLTKRRFKAVLVAATTFLLLQLPFLHLLHSFVSSVLGRTGSWRVDENISPSVLFCRLTGSVGLGCFLFYVLWVGTLIYRLDIDDSEKDSSCNWPELLPWVIAFPALVYPYTGVIVLPLLAKIAADCQGRPARSAEKVIFLGAGLRGFQAVAWCENVQRLVSIPALSIYATRVTWGLNLICPLGVALMIAGACGLVRYRLKRAPARV